MAKYIDMQADLVIDFYALFGFKKPKPKDEDKKDDEKPKENEE